MPLFNRHIVQNVYGFAVLQRIIDDMHKYAEKRVLEHGGWLDWCSAQDFISVSENYPSPHETTALSVLPFDNEYE